MASAQTLETPTEPHSQPQNAPKTSADSPAPKSSATPTFVEDELRSHGITPITSGSEFKAAMQRSWEKVRAERMAREDAALLPTAHMLRPAKLNGVVILSPGDKVTVAELRARCLAAMPQKPQLAEQAVQSLVRAANLPPPTSKPAA